MRKGTSLLNLSLSFALLILISCNTFGAGVPDISIISPSGATTAESLAAKEIRRYLYLRTGKLLPIVQTNNRPSLEKPLIIVAQKDRAVIKTLTPFPRNIFNNHSYATPANINRGGMANK